MCDIWYILCRFPLQAKIFLGDIHGVPEYHDIISVRDSGDHVQDKVPVNMCF